MPDTFGFCHSRDCLCNRLSSPNPNHPCIGGSFSVHAMVARGRSSNQVDPWTARQDPLSVSQDDGHVHFSLP